jgi:putative copper export protein
VGPLNLEPLSLFVRWAHVGGMAAILGGALLVWWLAAERDQVVRDVAVRAAERYEWIFWGAIGLQVMTGIGNLGAFGNGLPPPGSAWGTKLVIKLVSVLALAILSVPRTLAVATIARSVDPPLRNLSAVYGATTVGVIGILGLAVWLSHG